MQEGERVKLADSRHHAKYGYGTVIRWEPAMDEGGMLSSIDNITVRFDDGHEETFWHTELEDADNETAAAPQPNPERSAEQKGAELAEAFTDWLTGKLRSDTRRE